MASTVIKNWDNKTWLSSQNYIKLFNNFLIKNIKLNSDSKILDIGCGRGKILGALSSKLKLKNKPIGIDIIDHKDKDKRIIFKKIEAIKYFKRNNKNFDLILIKQTIHLLKFEEIKKLLANCNRKLNPDGKIIIFTLETTQNEIPTFLLMKKKLLKSLERDKKMLKFILNLYPNNIVKQFSFNVKISKKKYLEMIKNRYISTLLGFNLKQILKGINEVNSKYKDQLSFSDKLICIILKN